MHGDTGKCTWTPTQLSKECTEAKHHSDRFVTEYLVEGDVFIHNDIVIFLHRILHYPAGEREPREPRRTLPGLKEMAPLEKTGSYVLQASITVQDGSNQETMKMSSQHLLGLREQLKSAVRLEPADRLSLDTRAK